MGQPTDIAILRYAAEDHLSLRGDAVVRFDDVPQIDATPKGGTWVATWVWVPDELAAVCAEVMKENDSCRS